MQQYLPNKTKTILIVAGELSGDIYGASLVSKLKEKLPDYRYYGVGGDRMAEEGVHLIAHVRDIAVVGISEVLHSIKGIVEAFRILNASLKKEKPQSVVLIDYPGFNLFFARWVKKHNIPVVYFISPQVWAWRRGRIKLIKRVVSKMLVIFPFEEKMYRNAGVDVAYVGHPLVDKVRASDTLPAIRRKLEVKPDSRVVAILPGSRYNEIELLLPSMLEAVRIIGKSLPDVQFFLPAADTVSLSRIKKKIEDAKVPVHVVRNSTYDVIAIADFVIVASGTATLEVALLGTPFIICYRVKPVTFLIGKFLIKIPFIGLANIIAEKQVVPELIQHQVTPESIAEYALFILKNPDQAASVRRELSIVKQKLGHNGGAVEKVCDEIISFLDRDIPQFPDLL